MNIMSYLKPGIEMILFSFKRHLTGYIKINKNHEVICNNIIKSCYKKSVKYNKNYFVVSDGHFKQYYVRDFGMFIEPLIKTGWKKECFSTLDYALDVFSDHNKITTTISEDNAIDFFDYAVDSLSFFLRTIRVCLENNYPKYKILKYKKFLQSIIDDFKVKVYDERTKLVKSDKYFSSARDHYKRKSSSYDNSAMIGAMIEVDKINKLIGSNVFDKSIDINSSKKKFKDNLYNGKYFFEDLDKKQIIISDANIFPFYWGIFKDKKMISSCYKSIKKAGLDKFVPIKYSNKRDENKELLVPELFAPNYEGDTYWSHIGYCYLETMKDIDFENYRKNIKKMIRLMEKYENFLEVYDRKGKPYSSFFYTADANMIWCSGFLWLNESIK